MAQARVEQDENVTIVHTKIPEGRHTHIEVRPLEQIFIATRLSGEAERYLRRQGYSQRFIDALSMLIRSMTNTVVNTAANEETLRWQRQDRSPHMDYSRPEQPIRSQMPTNLANAWELHGLGTLNPPLRIPALGTYFPNTTQYPDIYKAFASAEGQRFMARYYTTGWLRQGQSEGEWIIAPPVPVSQIVPRRTEPASR